MNDEQREEMNKKYNLLFDQIVELKGDEERRDVLTALSLWQMAKNLESIGIGPMEANHGYKAAYEKLRDMGLEVGGMIVPYDREANLEEKQ